MRALVVIASIATLAVLLAAGKTQERVSSPRSYQTISTDSVKRQAAEVREVKTLKQLERYAHRPLILHMRDHRWFFSKGMTIKQRLRAYQTIAAHDRWMKKNRRLFTYETFLHHKRELRHALAHIDKINAKLHPVFTYPWWWVPLGECETGSSPPDPAYNGADGYDGWINFAPSTWDTYKQYVPSARRYSYAWQAPEYVQYLVTMAMHNSGIPWSQSNPACSARIGLS